jgi:hypothetical protein
VLAGHLAVAGQGIGDCPGWDEIAAGGRGADRLDDLVATR